MSILPRKKLMLGGIEKNGKFANILFQPTNIKEVELRAVRLCGIY